MAGKGNIRESIEIQVSNLETPNIDNTHKYALTERSRTTIFKHCHKSVGA